MKQIPQWIVFGASSADTKFNWSSEETDFFQSFINVLFSGLPVPWWRRQSWKSWGPIVLLKLYLDPYHFWLKPSITLRTLLKKTVPPAAEPAKAKSKAKAKGLPKKPKRKVEEDEADEADGETEPEPKKPKRTKKRSSWGILNDIRVFHTSFWIWKKVKIKSNQLCVRIVVNSVYTPTKVWWKMQS